MIASGKDFLQTRGSVRVYEATFILRTDPESVEKGQGLVKTTLEKSGSTVVSEEDLGERTLAYAIKKEPRGRYLFFEVQSDPDRIKEIDKTLLMAPEVLKYLIVRKDD